MTEDDRKAMEWASRRITELTAENQRLRADNERLRLEFEQARSTAVAVAARSQGVTTQQLEDYLVAAMGDLGAKAKAAAQRAGDERMLSMHPPPPMPPSVASSVSLPVIPQTCGECEYSWPALLSGTVGTTGWCERLSTPTVLDHAPFLHCPLRPKSEEP